MGAQRYYYFVNYQEDRDAALDELRRREFLAGRYNPVIAFPQFPVDLTIAPGPGHRSIQEAIAASEADGTRSILDLDGIADEPRFGAASPLSPAALQNIFGETEPTRVTVEDNLWKIFNLLDRGHGIYLILYYDGKPNEILFAGLSAD